MATITRAQAIAVLRRARGPEFAESVAAQLPDVIDIDDPKQQDRLAQLGITRDRLLNELGGEL